MWKMNDAYLARLGNEWPEVPVPEQVAFSRGTSGALAGIYEGLSNGDGSNIGSGSPMLNGWGFATNSVDYLTFQVAQPSGWPSTPYTLDWIMVTPPTGGGSNYVGGMLLRITTGTDLVNNIVYDGNIPVTLVVGSQTYQKVDIPPTGSIAGNTNFFMNTDYNIGISWDTTWPTSGGYFSGTGGQTRSNQTLTDGRAIYMNWHNNVSSSGGGWKNNNQTTPTGSMYGQLFLFGAGFL
tara:strand:+ start:11259 stop:11966 length:708 start_codon:yes stop_codon:yes gene_type:complete